MHEGHVYWESLDRTAWVLDWEVSNSETARDMEEGCDKGGVTPEMASYSILLQAPAAGSYQRKDAGLDGTSPPREQLFCSLLTCHWYPLLLLAPFPCSAPVPDLLKRDCKHQETLLLMRSSMTAAGNPCRNMCCAQGSRQQQYPALLPSLPSSTCNWNSRNPSPTTSYLRRIFPFLWEGVSKGKPCLSGTPPSSVPIPHV